MSFRKTNFKYNPSTKYSLSHPPPHQLAPLEPCLHRLPRQQPRPQHRVGAARDRWDQLRVMAPGPGEGEGDHGQHVLVLQLVKHGKPDVLFLGHPRHVHDGQSPPSLDLTSQPSPSAPTHSSPLPLTPSSHPCPSHFRASPHLLTSWYLLKKVNQA